MVLQCGRNDSCGQMRACPHVSYVVKCNLGKVNLEAMLVSSFSCYTGGGPMPLAGAPSDLYTQLLACSSLQRVFQKLAACMPFCALVFSIRPSLPLEVRAR